MGNATSDADADASAGPADPPAAGRRVRAPGERKPARAPVRTMDSLLITRATAAHVPYLRSLKEAVMRDRYNPAEDEEEFERWRERYCTDEYFQCIIDDQDALMLCIGTLREPAGMVVMHRRGERLEVDDLLVLHPRQGDGRRLLTACLRYAEAWRMHEAFIDVYPGRKHVVAFLRAHAFDLVDETSNELGRPMHRYARRLR